MVVKLNNVLVASTGKDRLADFGLSIKTKAVFREGSEIQGTLPYTAPDIFTRMESLIQTLVDMWACGDIIYAMATGECVSIL